MDDDLLVQELAKLGEFGTKLGGALSGNMKIPTGAASLGVEAVARFLPTERFSIQKKLEVSPEDLLKAGYSVLSKIGDLQQPGEINPPYPMLKAIVKSGFLNMNPSVVYLEILASGTSDSTVTITGAAKEGLIKQKTAEKSVNRVLSDLLNQLR